jgi:glycosyltransferase involved in cell wall biosynthesis
MRYSILICSYNSEKWIEIQLASIINQTIKPFEIIISDDASKDNTINIVKSFIEKHSEFNWVLLQNPVNLGANGNVLNALTFVKGDFLIFADHDDESSPNKCEVLCNLLKDSTVPALSFGDALIVDENLNSINKTWFQSHFINPAKIKNFANETLFANPIIGANTALNRMAIDLVVKKIPILTKIYSDHYIIALVANLGGKIIFTNEVLMKYRIHSNNTMGQKKSHSQIKRLFYCILQFAILPFYFLPIQFRRNRFFNYHLEIVKILSERGDKRFEPMLELSKLNRANYFMKNFFTGSINSVKCLVGWIKFNPKNR